MTPEFLVFANVLLCTRLLTLFKDDASAGRIWVRKALVEVLGLLALYRISGAWMGMSAVILLVNLLGWQWERRRQRRNLGRLALGAFGLIALSVFCAPQFSLEFRPELMRLDAVLRNVTTLAPLLQAFGSPHLHWYFFGLLLAANEANLVIRAVFDWLDLKPRLVAREGLVDVGEFNRGRVIGVLERILLYLFVIQGQLGAIGFILAAKAFTRFKALDDRPFAEYVLIGTLLSACLALAAGGLVQWWLHQ